MKKLLLSFLLWVLGTLLLLLGLALVAMVTYGEESWTSAWNYLPDVLRTLTTRLLPLLLLTVPFWLSRMALRVHKAYRRYQWRGALRSFAGVVLLPIGMLWGTYAGLKAYYQQSEDFDYVWKEGVENKLGRALNRATEDGKQRGMHVFLRRTDVAAELDQLVALNVEWITLVPFAYQGEANSPELRGGWNTDRPSPRRDSSFIAAAVAAQERGLKVLMKPHIWMNGDIWRNAIAMESEADWDQWFESYSAYILHYARMAEAYNMDMLCIGTELHACAKGQPARWRTLIRAIRQEFSGSLIYAANWYEEYEDIVFWDDLDYIGVQGYFPLDHGPEITVAELVQSWQPHVQALEALHQQWNKPIVFTEVGYKSVPNAAKKPWEWADYGGLTRVSNETQAYCYEALFQALWHQPWFAGLHWWKWEDEGPADFTPKGKPAANIMATWYGGYQE